MSEILREQGTTTTEPTSGLASGQPSLTVPWDESASMLKSACLQVDLTSDAQVVVPLGTLTAVHVLMIRAIGGPLQVSGTSTAGTNQVWPCDPLLKLWTLTVPLTAIKLTRAAGTTTQVEVYLWQAT